MVWVWLSQHARRSPRACSQIEGIESPFGYKASTHLAIPESTRHLTPIGGFSSYFRSSVSVLPFSVLWFPHFGFRTSAFSICPKWMLNTEVFSRSVYARIHTLYTCSLVNSLSKNLSHLHHQLLAPMEMFNWWEVLPHMRVEWRCASTMPGGQCVMTFGAVLMLQWSAGNWDMPPLDVSNSTIYPELYLCIPF